MPVKTKKRKQLHLRVGNQVITVTPVPVKEVADANLRIQKAIQPKFHQLKKIRRAASITASKIILNA